MSIHPLEVVILFVFGVHIEPWRLTQMQDAAAKHSVPLLDVASFCAVESRFGHPRHGTPVASRYWCGAFTAPDAQPYAIARVWRHALTACRTRRDALMYIVRGECGGRDRGGYVRMFRWAHRRLGGV